MSSIGDDDGPGNDRPPYSFVPGGPWPHPIRDPGGHSHGARGEGSLSRGVALFNLGYYWEAHEAWEAAWIGLGRNGPEADVVKGLIKLAASGVKVREGQPHGVLAHASRAADLFSSSIAALGPTAMGLDLGSLLAFARRVAASTYDRPDPGLAVAIVFDFRVG